MGGEAVESFVFTAPSKSRLGFTLLAMAGTGRCRLYRQDGGDARQQVQREIESARYELATNEQMRFFVPESEGHDDFLMSLALCCHAATLALPPPSSAIIPPRLDMRQAW
jgi:hypothetical protein